MNVKFAILSTIAIIAASVSVQSAEARDGMSARFEYAPNVWKNESVRMPAGYGEPAANPHSVTHGSMPKGSSLLGLDRTMLVRRPAPGPRVAPIAQANLSGSPSWTNLVPMLNPIAPVANKGQFGKPIDNTPVVASLPPQAAKPQTAQPKALAPSSTSSSVGGRLRSPARANTAVAGRLQPRARGLAAKPAAPIQSYGNNFYQAGSTVPTGSGFSSATNVSGRILYRSTQKH